MKFGERGKSTHRLAIFRVHSVAKPQLTALLGSYSSSYLPASFLLYLCLCSSGSRSHSHLSFLIIFVVPSPAFRPMSIFYTQLSLSLSLSLDRITRDPLVSSLMLCYSSNSFAFFRPTLFQALRLPFIYSHLSVFSTHIRRVLI